MNVIKSRSFSLVFEPQTFTLFHDRPFFINGGFCTGIGFCTPKKGSHFSRSLPVSNDYILKLPDTRIYLTLKNLSVKKHTSLIFGAKAAIYEKGR